MTQSRTIPRALILAGVMIALSILFTTSYSTSPSARIRPLGTSDHILGNPAARVVIIEYADFDCTYCKGFHETLHTLIAREGATGNVAWVFRHFPDIDLHPTALAHARAAECAALVGGNDTFWKFADALYSRQPVDPSSYGAIAAELDIEGDSFAHCYATASTLDTRILADRTNALDSGATHAPYSFIVRPGSAPLVLDGAYSYLDLKMFIDQILAE